MNGPETRSVDMGFLMAPELRPDKGSSISHVRLGEWLCDEDRTSALFTWNNNIVASSPAQSLIRKGLAREDLFTVATDIFQTDTTSYADYVLPAASFLEFDDLVLPYFHHTVSAQTKAASPPGEALPNQEIFRRLSRAMGYTEPQLQETDESLIARLLSQTSFEGSFDNLKAVGTARLFAEPQIQFRDLKFSTPSGKIEVASERLAAMGVSRSPSPAADTAPPFGKLRILSPASPWLMNSSYANDEMIKKRAGCQRVLLNPADLAARNITSGSLVRLTNEAGDLELEAQASDDVPVGVALIYKGAWPGLSAGQANVNVLNPGLLTDIGESSAVHGVTAELNVA